MSLTPTGSPVWSNSTAHTAYGGDLNKQNYLSQDAVDSRTDISAERWVRLCEDLAAVSRVLPFVKMRSRITDEQIPGINVHRCASAEALPLPEWVSNGVATFTWEDTYKDEYGVEQDIDFQHCQVFALNPSSGGQLAVAELSDTTGNGKNNRVTVRVFTDAGLAASSPLISLEVD